MSDWEDKDKVAFQERAAQEEIFRVVNLPTLPGRPKTSVPSVSQRQTLVVVGPLSGVLIWLYNRALEHLVAMATVYVLLGILSVITSSTGVNNFTPLHTYYISTTGSNANNCSTPALACADMSASSLSSVVCGDVVLVNTGSYTNQFNQNFPTPSGSCPSTSGGVGGTGGVYFAILLCAGPDVMSCKVDTSTSGGGAVWVNRSNWAIEGFWARTKPDGSNCFLANNANTGGTVIHHVAFINDGASTCGDAGFGSSGGGSSVGSSDQTAAVGVWAFDAANSQTHGAECGSAISFIPANGPDTSAGTHIYVAGAFLGYNTNTGTPGSLGCQVGGGHSDGEGIIFDTWGAGYTTNGYLYQGVIEQSAIWHSGGSSTQIFPQIPATPANDKAQYFIENNTMYAGDQDTTGNGICVADLHVHAISPNSGSTTSSIYDIQNNIVLATVKTCGGLGGNPSYAMNINPEGAGTTLIGKPINVANNYIWNSATPTSNVYNTSNNNVYLDTGSGARSATFIFGANTYSDPGLTNITSLWSTAPDCTGFEAVTPCMNTKYTVAAFAAPTIAPTSLGYQAPSTCQTLTLSNSTSSFPSYLNHVVYLHAVNGFTAGTPIVQKTNVLINQPCAS